jgi:succinate dehydrogenase / fumarate reductase, membrane anchor subunit
MITMPRWLTASGVRDWLLQRVTAVILLVYLVVLASFFAGGEAISYISWKQLFSEDILFFSL